MKIKIWGARGSIPTPLSAQAVRDKIIAALEGARGVDLDDPLALRAYVDSLPAHIAGTTGGNTACVELLAGDQTIIVDAGSGIRLCGQELMRGPCGRGQGTVHLFLSHTHWDHIQGFPFFAPAFIPGNRLFIYSVHDVAQTLRNQMHPTTFPVSLDYMRADIRFVPMGDGERLTIGGVRVSNMLLPHPGGAYAYRFEHGGAVFVYASDAEYKHLSERDLQPFVRFYAGADALIFDAQFTLRQALQKEDWGHSSALIGADLARRAGVKRLLLFHHDPLNNDNDLATILAQTTTYQTAQALESPCEIMLAAEGLALDLSPPYPFTFHRLPNDEAAILTITDGFDQAALTDLHSHHFGGAGVPTKLVVDLDNVPLLSIAALRALIELRRQSEGRALLLTHLSPQARQLIEASHCEDFFAIYPTVQAALAAMAAREALRLPGHLLAGRYHIERELGENEMGTVYKATDVRLDRPVTLKVLSPSLSQAATARFLRETQKMARLAAPNIVPIFDSAESDGLAYLVREYVAGHSLQVLMRQQQELGALPDSATIATLLSIMIEVLHGLEYAHSRGVVHGNLMPKSILVDNTSTKLTDFGLRWFEEGQSLMHSPFLFSSPAYLAPEQITGRPADSRSDLYAVGAILYELTTNRPPFLGDEQAVLQQHLTAQPTPPRQYNPEISPSLDHLILKLLAKAPEQRYSAATQVRHVLQSLIGGPAGESTEVAPEAPTAHHRCLIGRDLHLNKLLKLWEQAQVGSGQVVMVAGEAGVGKTSLAEEVAAHLRAATVLIGHCGEMEGSTPYLPFVEIGQDYLDKIPEALLRAQLGAEAAPLATLIPAIRTLLPDLPHPTPLEPEQERLRLMHGFAQVVARAAVERPWLLILDDLHWADPASLQLFHYLARTIVSMPVLLVGIYRDVELDPAHALAEMLRGLSRFPHYHHITLDRLDRDAVRLMLEALWRQPLPAEWVSTIYEHTGGNPFYIEEVARGLMEEGAVRLEDGHWRFAPAVEIRLPQSIRDIVRRRVARVRPETQEVLRRAAVLGQLVPFTDLAAVSELAEDALLEAIDEALERDLMRESDGGTSLAFSHAEIQQVIYEDLSAMRRRTLHRRVGEALEQLHGGDLDAIAGQLAHHFIQAGESEKRHRYCLRAAAQARARHAYQAAITWYRQALAFMPDTEAFAAQRIEPYYVLGTMLRAQARFAEACDAFRAMAAAAAQANDALAEARAWTGLSNVQIRQGDLREARLSAGRAEEVARAAGAERELAGALVRKGWTFVGSGQPEEALALGEQALALSTRTNARDVTSHSYNLLGSIYIQIGRFEEAAAHYQEAINLARELGDQMSLSALINNLGETARRRGDFQTAVTLYADALTLARQTGFRALEVTVLSNAGGARLGLGALREAENDLRQAVRIAESVGLPDAPAETYRFLAETCLAQGKHEEAIEAAQRALLIARAAEAFDQIGSAWRTLGTVVAQGRVQLNIDGTDYTPDACFAESLRLLTRANLVEERARTLRAWALYASAQGEPEQAARLWQEATALFAQLGISPEATSTESPGAALSPASPAPS